jgi:hypothetical protein
LYSFALGGTHLGSQVGPKLLPLGAFEFLVDLTKFIEDILVQRRLARSSLDLVLQLVSRFVETEIWLNDHIGVERIGSKSLY